MRKTFWIILSSVFLGGATIFLSMFLLQDDMSEVEVISVRQGKLSETIFTTGVVEPKRVTRHYSPLSGIVSEVFINQNEPVTKGQILFELDTADFEKQLKIENVNLQLCYSSLKIITLNNL